MFQRRSMAMIILMLGMALQPLLAEGDNAVRKVDINIANKQELAQIPFINLELAQSIVLYREKVGGFVMFEELIQVEGFNRDLFLKVKPYLYLDGVSGEDCGC